VIKEKDRNIILQRRKVMRRHNTLARQATDEFYFALQVAHENGATPTELAKLLDLSVQRLKQIVYDKEDING